MQLAVKSGSGSIFGAMTRGVAALVRRRGDDAEPEAAAVERLEPGELVIPDALFAEVGPIRPAPGCAPVVERESFDSYDPETEVIAIFYEEQIDFETGTLRTPKVEVVHADGDATVMLDGLAIADVARAAQLTAQDIALIPA